MIFLQDLILNFLRISSDLHEDRIKIEPGVYYILKERIVENGNLDFYKHRFEEMKNVFETYFQQLLYVTKYLSIPIYMLLKVPNRKMVSDMIFLSEKPKQGIGDYNIICSSPQKLKYYQSNAYIKKFVDENFIVCQDDEKLVCLDYSSMYPCMMLSLFENNPKLKPYCDTIKKFYELKVKEQDVKKKHVYKLILNAIYGSFGVSKLKKQFLICGNTFIAERTCSGSRRLLTDTISYFEKIENVKVIYCNTDSIVVIGKLNKIKSSLQKWNEKYKPDAYKYSTLTIERIGKKILFLNKQVRIWLTDNEIKCIGWKFNSVKTPRVIRLLLKYIMKICMKKTDNIEEFKVVFMKEANNVIKGCDLVKLKSLFDLVSVSKIKTRKDEFKYIDCLHNYQNNLDLRFTIKVFSRIDIELFKEEDYEIAEEYLYNSKIKDFKIGKRLHGYVEKLFKFINKL